MPSCPSPPAVSPVHTCCCQAAHGRHPGTSPAPASRIARSGLQVTDVGQRLCRHGTAVQLKQLHEPGSPQAGPGHTARRAVIRPRIAAFRLSCLRVRYRQGRLIRMQQRLGQQVTAKRRCQRWQVGARLTGPVRQCAVTLTGEDFLQTVQEKVVKGF